MSLLIRLALFVKHLTLSMIQRFVRSYPVRTVQSRQSQKQPHRAHVAMNRTVQFSKDNLSCFTADTPPTFCAVREAALLPVCGKNLYLMQKIEILDVIPETAVDYTYALAWNKPLKPGQFLQVSIPTPASSSQPFARWAV
ncbi:MAG: hypothetical protein ABSG91_06345 [Syntrophobacteraceae bacterium]